MIKTTNNPAEIDKAIKELKANAAQSTENRTDEIIKDDSLLSIFGRTGNSIREFIKDCLRKELLYEKMENKGDKSATQALASVRQRLNFYVSIAFMQKQDKYSRLLILLNLLVISLMIYEIFLKRCFN